MDALYILYSQHECGAEAKRHCAVRPRNYSWAELLKRVFLADPLHCDRCGGRMRTIAAVNPPEAIRRILDCLGLPSRAPPTADAAPEGDSADFESF